MQRGLLQSPAQNNTGAPTPERHLAVALSSLASCMTRNCNTPCMDLMLRGVQGRSSNAVHTRTCSRELGEEGEGTRRHALPPPVRSCTYWQFRRRCSVPDGLGDAQCLHSLHGVLGLSGVQGFTI